MSERVMGNIFVRTCDVLQKKGGRIDGDVHNFDHVTMILRGSVHAVKKKRDGTVMVDRRIEAPACLLIEADMLHSFESLEDGTTAWCVYAHRTPQGEVTQEYNGWLDAYG
jgi:hypothetical protein